MSTTEFGMIAADTSRTRAYLSALERNGLLPAWVLLLETSADESRPGQAKSSRNLLADDPAWPESVFNPTAPLRPWLDRLGIRYDVSPVADINAPETIELIAACSPQVLVFSGFGGALLRDAVLGTGKQFLHVHGGYLPDFKGSTTNYYSLLAEGQLGASSLFLTAEIDSGPVIIRRRFTAPTDRTRIDHVYDSAARASVLVDTLKAWRACGHWNVELPASRGGDTYYIIHPVLKHLAILGHSGQHRD